MESKLLSAQQKSCKRTTQEKKKKLKKKKNEEEEEDKSIKVVYISNPMRVTTTPSEFKFRVQELTGRDSDVSEFFDDFVDAPILIDNALKDQAQLRGSSASTRSSSMEAAAASASEKLGGAGEGLGRVHGEESYKDCSSIPMPFGMFDDDVFGSQLLESFPGFDDSPVASPRLLDGFRRLAGGA